MIEYHGHHIVTLLRLLQLMWNLFEIVMGTGASAIPVFDGSALLFDELMRVDVS